MLSAFYGVWAARQNNRGLSLKFLEQGYGAFRTGRFSQILEYRANKFPEQPMAGPFFANMGGFLMSLLLGFPQLKPGPGDPRNWGQRAVVLPKGWTAIEVERLWVRGQPAKLTARHGAVTSLEF